MIYGSRLDHFVEYAGILIVPSLLVGVAVAVVVTALAAALPATSRLVRTAFIALGTLLGVAAPWLVLYAAGADSDYDPQHFSRWEHAKRFMGTTPIVLCVVGAVATCSLLFVSACSPARRVLHVSAAPAAALSCVLLLFGWFALTAGH